MSGTVSQIVQPSSFRLRYPYRRFGAQALDTLPSPAQIIAGRALIGWSQQQLADASHTSRRTVATFEGGGLVSHETINSLKIAVEEAGVEFTGSGGSEGVRRNGAG